MAMEQLGMKVADMGFQTVNTGKAGGRVGNVSDDFRNLLQSKQDGLQSSQKKENESQVSKDTKPEKTDDVTEDVKTDEGTEDTGKAEEPKEDNARTDEMLAAYQSTQSMRPEIIQIAPEAETEAVIPDMTGSEVQSEGQMAAEIPEAVHDSAVQILAGNEKGQQEVVTAKPVQQQETDQIPEEAAAVKPADSKPVTHAEQPQDRQTSDFASHLKRTQKQEPVKEDGEVQTGNYAAEQAAAVSAETPETVQVEEKEFHNENISTVHAEQPEELPEKVTDQLLARLVEGVKEFEIHIEPANLGKIAVKILYEGSQAHVSIICSEKRAMDVLGQNAREIGNVLSKNFGGETTIIVEKQETDYLNQTRDENEHANQEQQKPKENNKNQDGEDAEQFLQKLRLGLAGWGKET